MKLLKYIYLLWEIEARITYKIIFFHLKQFLHPNEIIQLPRYILRLIDWDFSLSFYRIYVLFTMGITIPHQDCEHYLVLGCALPLLIYSDTLTTLSSARKDQRPVQARNVPTATARSLGGTWTLPEPSGTLRGAASLCFALPTGRDLERREGAETPKLRRTSSGGSLAVFTPATKSQAAGQVMCSQTANHSAKQKSNC